MSSLNGCAEDFPLRPLLFAIGAAATAVSIYCYVKKGDGKIPQNTSGPEAAVCEQATEPAVVQPTEDLQDQVTVSLAVAEEKHQKAVETIIQLEIENTGLKKEVETLSRAVQDVVEGVFESNNVCEEYMDEREKKGRSILQMTYDEMKKSLTYKEEILKVFLSEAEEKQEMAMEIISQLERKNAELLSKVETLKDTMQHMGQQLIETNIECDELIDNHVQECEAYNILQEECHELKVTLFHIEERQKVFLAEAEKKHQMAVETINQLEIEKSDLKELEKELTKQLETQRVTVQDMGTDTCELNRECDELMDVKHLKALETIAQLEEEKFALSKQLETLRVTVQDMGHDLYETNRECDELTDEREQGQEVHRILQSEHQVTKDKLKHCEELLVDTTEEREQKAVQFTDEHEAGKSGLKTHMDTVRDTLRGKVKGIKNRLSKRPKTNWTNLQNRKRRQEKARQKPT